MCICISQWDLPLTIFLTILCFFFFVSSQMDSLLSPVAPVKLIEGISSVAFSSSVYQGSVRTIFVSNNNRASWEGVLNILVPLDCIEAAPVKCVWLRGLTGDCATFGPSFSSVNAKFAIEPYETSVIQVRCS